MEDANWWLHLYVMFSRATQMSDLLLLRPPSREFLERGPPVDLLRAPRSFEAHTAATNTDAERLAELYGIALPLA